MALKQITYSIIAATSVILAAIILIFTTQIAGAGGGVGSGGSGGGGGGSGWGWTTYGHGWAMYNISGGGPTAGFHTGNWSAIKSECQDANASSVAIYILGTGTNPLTGAAIPSGDFMGYDYVGWSGTWTGGSRDNGRASGISVSTAKSRFDSLSSYGVSTTGYTWGSNVGWFCWNFEDPEATLDVQKEADGKIGTGQSFDFNLSIRATKRQYVGDATFDWRLDYSSNNGSTWSEVASNTKAIAGTNPRVERTPSGPPGPSSIFNSPGTFCYRLVITSKPSWAVYDDKSGKQCVTVVAPIPADFEPNTIKSGNYEKGDDPVTFNHYIKVNTFPCNLALGTWIDDSPWEASPSNNGGAATEIGSLQSGTLEFENCGNKIRLEKDNSKIISATSGDRYLLFSYSTSGDTSILDSASPGNLFARQTVVGGKTNIASFIVYEAPFARFFGNDVKVCGNSSSINVGADNRFIFDNDGITSTTYSGSFVQYASIYRNNNLPGSNYSGLQSDSSLGTWDRLLANYSAISCTSDVSKLGLGSFTGTGLVTIDSKDYTSPTTIYVNGSVDIIGTGINTNSGAYNSSNMDIDTFPVVLIYATDDINISASVSNIEAVLIAGKSINTCKEVIDGGGTNIAKAKRISSDCNKPLKIKGAISAPTINLQRAKGTRYLADPKTTTTVSTSNSTAAEIIEFPWYLNYVNIADLPNDSQGGYKAYYSLPPRL